MPKEVGVSGHVVLACRSCGERVVLLGRPGDWYRQGGVRFRCECGPEVTLADRIAGEVNLDVAVPPLLFRTQVPPILLTWISCK